MSAMCTFNTESIVMVEPSQYENESFSMSFAYGNDIGGSRNRSQQDRVKVMVSPDKKIVLLFVGDGHGIEHGELASETAQTNIEIELAANYLEAYTNPHNFLKQIIMNTHASIRESIIKKCNRLVNPCYVNPDTGTLFHDIHFTRPIHGGTTITVLMIINDIMYCGNLGDSKAVLYSPTSCFLPKHKIGTTSISDVPSNYLDLIGDHSPENILEYKRMLAFRPSTVDPLKPMMKFEYDKNFEPIFANDSDGNVVVSGKKGAYYKNVSHEFGSLVSGPNDTSLAFTRSSGDFFLHEYGLTCEPDIFEIDIKSIMSQTNLVIGVIASDGVWDNMTDETVHEFVTHSTCIDALSNVEGIQKIASSFLTRNNLLGKINFGNSADNASAIVFSITKK
uniref:PPM-type phosphatase domain-containing protein n=1 Tax=viral metagenome TaxID=1070528 RepID=A0A6C0DAM4_9ZZZZ